MEQWFEALVLFERVYWIIAGVASAIFLVLLVITLLGGDSDTVEGDVDTEIEGDTGIHFQFLSFKNLIGFLTIFGWSGIAALHAELPKFAVVLISVICGLLMMLAMASLFYYLAILCTDNGILIVELLNK